MHPEKRSAIEVRCIVSARNAGGEPDLFFVKVIANGDQLDDGQHYEAAKLKCLEEGYEPHLAYDELDSAGKSMLDLFEWDTASTVNISNKDE